MASLYRGVPLHIWNAALDLARGRRADGSVPKLPIAAVLHYADGGAPDLRTYALDVAVLLKFWGYLKTPLAKELPVVLDSFFGADWLFLERIMDEPGADTLPGVFTPASPEWVVPAATDKYKLASRLRPTLWAAAKQYGATILHVDIECLPLSDQLFLVAVAKESTDAEKGPVPMMAAMAQELCEMADADQFDLQRVDYVIDELSRARSKAG